MNDQIFCTRCGAVNAASARFCQQCGNRLLGPAAAGAQARRRTERRSAGGDDVSPPARPNMRDSSSGTHVPLRRALQAEREQGPTEREIDMSAIYDEPSIQQRPAVLEEPVSAPPPPRPPVPRRRSRRGRLVAAGIAATVVVALAGASVVPGAPGHGLLTGLVSQVPAGGTAVAASQSQADKSGCLVKIGRDDLRLQGVKGVATGIVMRLAASGPQKRSDFIGESQNSE